jgi:hypothetical protein
MDSSEVRKTAGGSRKVTLVQLIVGALLLATGLLIGITDNPPGVALVVAGVCLFILAAVHRWHTARKYLLLAGAAVVGFVLLAVVHNIAHHLVDITDGMIVLSQALEVVSVAAFLGAILVCPPAVLVGLLGAVWMTLRRSQEPGVNA